MNSNQEQFVKDVCRACLEWEGKSTLAPAVKRNISVVTVAQAVLETGWGSNWLAHDPFNNLGGVKHHLSQWPGVSSQTREVIDGQNQIIEDSFQTYPTVADYIADHFTVLWRWKCVRDAAPVSTVALCAVLGPWTDADRAFMKAGNADACQHSNYSTDPRYASILEQLIGNCGLSDPAKLEVIAA